MRIAFEHHFKTSLSLCFEDQRTQPGPSSPRAGRPDLAASSVCHFVMQRPTHTGLLSCGDGKKTSTLMAVSLLAVGLRYHV